MDEERQHCLPKAETPVKNIKGKKAQEGYKSNRQNTRCPEQRFYRKNSDMSPPNRRIR